MTLSLQMCKILSCTSPPNAIYANTKSAGSGRGKTPGLNGRAAARPVPPFWPVKKNSGPYGQTRPVGGMAGLVNEKERAQMILPTCDRTCVFSCRRFDCAMSTLHYIKII